MITCPTVLMEFGSEQIAQVVNNAELIFTCSDVRKYVYIWHKIHAAAVLNIFSQIFKDVKEDHPDSLTFSESERFEEEVDDWEEIIGDESFLELLNQTEWELESTFDSDEIVTVMYKVPRWWLFFAG